MMPQKLVAARVGGGEDPLEQKLDGWQQAGAVFEHRKSEYHRTSGSIRSKCIRVPRAERRR